MVLAKKSLVFKLSSDNHLSFGSRQFPGDDRNDTPEITEINPVSGVLIDVVTHSLSLSLSFSLSLSRSLVF